LPVFFILTKFFEVVKRYVSISVNKALTVFDGCLSRVRLEGLVEMGLGAKSRFNGYLKHGFFPCHYQTLSHFNTLFHGVFKWR
jgi:hypothetical protein